MFITSSFLSISMIPFYWRFFLNLVFFNHIKPMSNCWNFQDAYEKMLNITHYSVQSLSCVQLFATPMDCSTPGYPVHHQSKPQWGVISYWSEWLQSKSLQNINAREGVEEREPSYTIGRNANWYSHYGEQCGDSLKNWK